MLIDISQVLLSCAPVWEHPDIKKLPHNNVNFNELADVIPWRDHWMQTIYYLPSEVQLNVNNNVSLVGYHDEYSFWFDIKNGPMYVLFSLLHFVHLVIHILHIVHDYYTSNI